MAITVRNIASIIFFWKKKNSICQRLIHILGFYDDTHTYVNIYNLAQLQSHLRKVLQIANNFPTSFFFFPFHIIYWNLFVVT